MSQGPPGGIARVIQRRQNRKRDYAFPESEGLLVARNDAYYDKARPYLDRIDVVVYPDISAESSALIAGDTDLISTAQPTEYGRLVKAAGVKGLRVPSGQFCNVNFGCDQKPFNDPRVRQALALTVDRAAMVDFVTEGFGSAGNDTPLNPAYRFYAEQPLGFYVRAALEATSRGDIEHLEWMRTTWPDRWLVVTAARN